MFSELQPNMPPDMHNVFNVAHPMPIDTRDVPSVVPSDVNNTSVAMPIDVAMPTDVPMDVMNQSTAPLSHLQYDFLTAPIDSFHSDLPDTSLSHRPQRTRRPPSYLKDFYCNLLKEESSSEFPVLQSGAPYSLKNFVSYNNLSSTHRRYVLNISTEFNQSIFIKLSNFRNGGRPWMMKLLPWSG
ncbi:uncharacterized protein LOC111017489 [Momordica charantia]|uniref:Uncharacterized protein LOC111017489 n=1 Tax=Momordica charantia TaxID=3673 RepID=A0A6J1D5J6_MOMCH|nr:uncharacterized protein LOC111017489 [Momordica charantia]